MIVVFYFRHHGTRAVGYGQQLPEVTCLRMEVDIAATAEIRPSYLIDDAFGIIALGCSYAASASELVDFLRYCFWKAGMPLPRVAVRRILYSDIRLNCLRSG